MSSQHQHPVILRSRRRSAGPKDLNRGIYTIRRASSIAPIQRASRRSAQNANIFLPLSFDSIILVCYGAEVGENSAISEGMTYFSDC
jgi:hypothetical protein